MFESSLVMYNVCGGHFVYLTPSAKNLATPLDKDQV